MSFENGELYGPNEYIYTGQQTGIDADGASAITGFVTTLDSLGEIRTPNGALQFVQLVGVTDSELHALIEEKRTVPELLAQIGSSLTDYKRSPVV